MEEICIIEAGAAQILGGWDPVTSLVFLSIHILSFQVGH